MPPWRASARVARGRERVLEADLGLVAAARSSRPRRRRTPCRGVCPGARSTTRRGSTRRSALRRRAARPGAGRSRRSPRRSPPSARRAAAGGAGPSARCARPTAGTGRGRRGSRTSGRRRPARRRRRHHSTSKRDVDGPELDAVAGAQRRAAAAATARPLTRTPLVEPRSAIVQPSPRGAHLGVPARDVGVAEHDVALAAAADRGAARGRRRSACPRRRGSPARAGALRASWSSSWAARAVE